MIAHAYFISPRGKLVPVTMGKHIEGLFRKGWVRRPQFYQNETARNRTR